LLSYCPAAPPAGSGALGSAASLLVSKKLEELKLDELELGSLDETAAAFESAGVEAGAEI
jgi:hypothetical protein